MESSIAQKAFENAGAGGTEITNDPAGEEALKAAKAAKDTVGRAGAAGSGEPADKGKKDDQTKADEEAGTGKEAATVSDQEGAKKRPSLFGAFSKKPGEGGDKGETAQAGQQGVSPELQKKLDSLEKYYEETQPIINDLKSGKLPGGISIMDLLNKGGAPAAEGGKPVAFDPNTMDKDQYYAQVIEQHIAEQVESRTKKILDEKMGPYSKKFDELETREKENEKTEKLNGSLDKLARHKMFGAYFLQLWPAMEQIFAANPVMRDMEPDNAAMTAYANAFFRELLTNPEFATEQIRSINEGALKKNKDLLDKMNLGGDKGSAGGGAPPEGETGAEKKKKDFVESLQSAGSSPKMKAFLGFPGKS